MSAMVIASSGDEVSNLDANFSVDEFDKNIL